LWSHKFTKPVETLDFVTCQDLTLILRKITQEENNSNNIKITVRYQKDLYKNNTNTILVGHHTRSLDDIKKFLFDINSFHDVEYKYYGFDTILFKVRNNQKILVSLIN
jgi:hypothetical protein